MKKLSKILLAFSMIATLCACGNKGTDTITGTYSYHVGGYDWGCGTDKAILTLDNPVDSVSVDDFTVSETKATTDWSDPNFAVKELTFDRVVTKAYLCDESGNEVSEASQYVALELYVSPNDGSPFSYSMTTDLNSWCDPYYLTICLSETAELTSGGEKIANFTIAKEATGKTTAADIFEEKDFVGTDGTTYSYSTYTVEGAKTVFVWLHGSGEGGTDTTVTLLANKVTAFASEEFQNAVGGASILVPQIQTVWMDEEGTGTYSGNADGSSVFLDSLTELVDQYKKETGAEKVVFAGCSNGGYMTLAMALAHGDKYDAYVPICEAVNNDEIDEEEIKALATLPIYFIYSEDDTTCIPEELSIATYNRLINAGAKNVHISSTEHVVDMSGLYKNEDGTPYQYDGHWSWIYFDNNDSQCDKCQVKAWEWIGSVVNPQ